MELMTFSDAVDDARQCYEVKPAILLGNGFSIAYDSELFCYENLSEKAEFKGLSISLSELRGITQGTDFEERVMVLQHAASAAEVYGGGSEMVNRMWADSEIIRKELAEVIAGLHPDNAYSLTKHQAQMARSFLSPFRKIFSLNYDLLVHWAYHGPHGGKGGAKRDGFQWPSYARTGSLVWKSEFRRTFTTYTAPCICSKRRGGCGS